MQGIKDIGESGENIYNGFVDYTKALEAVVTEQLPAVQDQADDLPHRAEQAKDHAKSELEALDLMKKGKAVMTIGFNIKNLSKIPAFVRTAAEGIKGDLQEVKDAIDELKANLPQVAINAKKCNAQGVSKPVDCYKLIYGPIKYTMEQRMEWEAKMKAKLSWRFKPEDYPLTDLMTPEEAAALQQKDQQKK